MSGYVNNLTDKDEGKDREKKTKLMSFRIDDDKLLEKYKTVWTKIKYLQNIKWNALPPNDDRCQNQNKDKHLYQFLWFKCGRR